MHPPTLILINGRPASGKSTLANQLAEDYRLPIISKDNLKEQLFDSLGWSDREWSRRMGKAASEIQYSIIESLIAVGQSLIAESNFVPAFAEPVFKRLYDHYHLHIIQIVCTASPETLLARFQARAKLENRHRGYRDQENTDEIIESLQHPFNPLRLPGQIIILQTDHNSSTAYEEMYRALHNTGLTRQSSTQLESRTSHRRRQPWLIPSGH